MIKQIHFYAANNDIIPVIEHFESEVLVKYARFAHELKPSFVSFGNGLELPGLGIADKKVRF